MNLTTAIESVFLAGMKEMIELCGEREDKSGFRQNYARLMETLAPYPALQEVVTKMQKAEKLALMHSELSEGLEGLRGINQSDKIPGFTSEEEEIADQFIRAMAYAHMFNLRLAEAIVAKLQYNATRPFKHGKNF